ncbi:MAG: glycosyltransferase family 39 protein [Bacteroidota bacterium]|nr:glycosyltransferase family 39 protein [Bacteroidota bacterium]
MIRNSINNIVKLIVHKHFILTCFILSIILRIFWLLWLNPEIVSDADWYFEKAKMIAEGKGYFSFGHPTAFYPVGYSAFLSFFFKIFESSILIGRVLNIFLYIGILFFVYKITKIFFSDKLTINLSFLFLAFYPNHIAYTTLLYNETLFLFLFSISIFLFLLSLKNQKIISFFITGILFGLSCYVKPQALFIPLIFFIVSYVKNSKKNIPLFLLVLYFGLFLSVLPWQLRNYKAFGKVTFISTVKGYDLLIGNNPYAKGNYGINENYWRKISLEENECIYDKKTKKLALKYIRNHPLESIKIIPKKLYYFFWPGMEGFGWNMNGLSENQMKILHKLRYYSMGAFLLFLIIFSISVVYQLFWNYKQISFATLAIYLLLLYHIILSTVFFGESRFHFHLVPFMLMLVSDLISKILTKLKLYNQSKLHRH